MINDFYYNTIDIIEKSLNVSETFFVIKGFETKNGFLIDTEGDKVVHLPKDLYKKIIEFGYENKCKIELVNER